jgi:hypothetical protein
MESSKREGSAKSVDATADRLLTSFCQRGVGGDNIVTIVIIKLLVTTARELKKIFQSVSIVSAECSKLRRGTTYIANHRHRDILGLDDGFRGRDIIGKRLWRVLQLSTFLLIAS